MGALDQEKQNSYNLISQQPDIGEINLYAKDSYKVKYQFLINKQKSTGSNHLNDS